MTLTIQPIGEREFDLYALSLLRGPNFNCHVFHSAWKTPRGTAVGAVLVDPEQQTFRALVMRRRVDHRFTVTHRMDSSTSPDEAAGHPH